jgi:hypothetical protein
MHSWTHNCLTTQFGCWIRCSFKINPDNGVEAIKGMQDAINQFVSWRPNGPSFRNSTESKDNYSVDELMTDLRKGIFLS